MFMESKLLKELNKNIKILNERIEKQNSLWRNFLLSIFRGVGYFIGVTIVAGILIYFLSIIIKTVEIPILQDFITANQMEELRIE